MSRLRRIELRIGLPALPVVVGILPFSSLFELARSADFPPLTPFGQYVDNSVVGIVALPSA